jgi:RHH-type transcriptional regulator, rel operon repressor / antitoxin RelB
MVYDGTSLISYVIRAHMVYALTGDRDGSRYRSVNGQHPCRFAVTARYCGAGNGAVTRVGITQALEHFVAVQAWQVAEIHKALAEADAGDFAIAEEIAALNNKYQS